MVDRLLGLGHDPIVGCHDKDDDVRHLCTTGAHHGEGGVAGGIEEDDVPLAQQVHLVGTDVLGDPTILPLHHLGLADGVEELRLSMVDVTHDRDDRCTVDQVFVAVGLAADQGLVIEGDEAHLTVILTADDLGGLIVDLLVDSDHHPHLEELGDDITGLEVHLLGQVTDRNDLHHVDGLGN